MSDLIAPDDPIDAVRDLAEQMLVTALDARARAVAGRYPEVEMRTWDAQEAAARAFAASTASPMEAAYLADLAARRGETVAALVPSIIGKATVFRLVGNLVNGARKDGFAAIATAQDASEARAAVAAALASFDAAVAALAPPA